nr:MAG TPA: hypothetical protein [Caudoviricetes sp.]
MKRNFITEEDDKIKLLADLIANYGGEMSIDDFDILTMGADEKVSVRTLERVINEITEKSREDLVSTVVEARDNRRVLRDVILKALDIMELNGDVIRTTRRTGRGYEEEYTLVNRRKNSSSRSSRYDRYNKDDRRSENSDLESVAILVDKYLSKNNIPFPSTSTAFVSLLSRLRKKANDPDIIAFRGSAKELYDVMVKDMR